MPSMEDTQAAWRQLKQALHHHEIWYANLIRTLACRLPLDPRDLAEDAHRHCHFGQWYYHDDSRAFHISPAFQAMEEEHKQMHLWAARLLRQSQQGAPISSHDYDAFANSLDRLRLQIHTLTEEFENRLYRLDPLTGAESRVGMLTHLREMHELSRRGTRSCCIAILDLDRFKVINDIHGHLKGDQVLVAVVQHAKAQMRPYDKIFRYGGEEFLLCLPDTDLPSGEALAERIRERLGQIPLAYDDHNPIFVTASIGLSLLDPRISVEESIDHADKALYEAKSAGRNCVRRWASAQ